MAQPPGEAAKGITTVVTWTLTPTTGGVLVRMEQSGFRPEDESNYKGAGYGWQKFVGALEQGPQGCTNPAAWRWSAVAHRKLRATS
jgi:uncharacterized protein YndB with AHSA1/START domain